MPTKISFVLHSPRNPKNIGASARGMANFGFRDLRVVNPYSVAWRETVSAVRAEEVVKKAKKFKTLKAAVKSTHIVIGTSAGSRRNLPTRWIGLEEFREITHASTKAGKSVAVVFGSERSGLSNKDLTFCHYVLKIPTAPECPSMNLSQAVAVAACAIRSPYSTATKPIKSSNVSVEHREKLVERALEAYTKAGLLKGWADGRGLARLRKAFHRWDLTEEDILMLHGIFSWVIKKT